MLNVRTNGVKTKNQLAPIIAGPDHKITNKMSMNIGKKHIRTAPTTKTVVLSALFSLANRFTSPRGICSVFIFL